MGDPKKHKKKYQAPKKKWEAGRIEEEKRLRKEYGYKTKKELWKMDSTLRKYRNQARKLISDRTEQGKKEREQLLDSLYGMGMLEKEAKLDDVLGLEIKDIMQRRLQTVLKEKKIANTIKHSRQLITHGFIIVGNKVVKSPNYLVKRQEEGDIKMKGEKLGAKSK